MQPVVAHTQEAIIRLIKYQRKWSCKLHYFILHHTYV